VGKKKNHSLPFSNQVKKGSREEEERRKLCVKILSTRGGKNHSTESKYPEESLMMTQKLVIRDGGWVQPRKHQGKTAEGRKGGTRWRLTRGIRRDELG